MGARLMLRTFLGIIVLTLAASHATSAGNADIQGVWRDDKVAWTFEFDGKGILTMREADPTDETSYVGDIVGIADKVSANEWVGQHIWGGRKYGSTKWGETGGLYVKVLSDTKLFVHYRDSIYADGWTLSR